MAVGVLPGCGCEANGVPAGVILMWAGLLADIPDGWLLCDGTGGTPDLRDRFVKGAAAAVEPGGLGGAATHGHGVTQPAAHAAHVVTQPNAHAVTQPAAHAAHVVTQPNAHVVTQPSNHGAHDHAYTQVVNHTHPERVASAATGGLVGSTPDASTNTSVLSGYSTDNPAGGVASGTTAGPGAALTHAGTAVDAHGGTAVDGHSAHAGTAVDAHGGTAVDGHSAHAGTAVADGSSGPAYYALAFIQKAAA